MAGMDDNERPDWMCEHGAAGHECSICDELEETRRVKRELRDALVEEADVTSKVSGLQDRAEELGIDVQALRAQAGLA